MEESGNCVQMLADDRQGDVNSQRPEWVRVDTAIKLFGISRSKIYELITDRRIKSFCLREQDRVKGIRLISFDSLSEFLANQAKAQEEASVL